MPEQTITPAEPMTPGRLAEAEGAIPEQYGSEWTYVRGAMEADGKPVLVILDEHDVVIATVDIEQPEVAGFITEARQAVPELVAEVKRLNEIVRLGDWLRQGQAGHPTLGEHIGALVAWLDSTNPRTDHEISMRLLKVVEEAGEVASAYIGMTGQNPRKGVTHTAADVQKELADVAVTALVALASLTEHGQEHTVGQLLMDHLACLRERVGLIAEQAVNHG